MGEGNLYYILSHYNIYIYGCKKKPLNSFLQVRPLHAVVFIDGLMLNNRKCHET